MTQAQLFDTFDISTLTLSPPKASKMAAGCKTAYIQAGVGKKIAIQTPLMTLPWDIVPRKLDENANVSANLSLSFVGIDENDPENELLRFKKFLLDFDIKIKTLIEQMDGALGKKSESKVLDANFKDTIKESNTGEYPPTIQPKIWLITKAGGSSKCVDDHIMEIQVFNIEGHEISDKELKKNCPAAAIIIPNYVWCSTLGVGITWSVKQVVIQPQLDEQFSNFKLGPMFDNLKNDDNAKRAKYNNDGYENENENKFEYEDEDENGSEHEQDQYHESEN